MARNEARVRIPAPPKQPTQEDLERQDLLARIEALEAEAKRRNPQFRVPEPPQGLQRRRVTAE